MVKKSLMVMLVLVGATSAHAGALHLWSSSVTDDGNIRNDLTIELTPDEILNWTNERLNISTPDGGQVFFGALDATLFHLDLTIPGLADDTGIMGPVGSLTVPSDESLTYTTVGWGKPGVVGAPAGIVYSLTLDPTTQGSVEALAYGGGQLLTTQSFAIVDGHVLPEPATIGLLALGALTLIRRR